MAENEPSISTRRISLRLGVSKSRVWRILKRDNFRPYHLRRVQELQPTDPGKRLEFCNWLMEKYFEDEGFIQRILWTDESQFTKDGVLSLHNLHHWAVENPHQTRESRSQHRFHLNVWAGVIGNTLVGPHILPPNMTGDLYLQFLQENTPELLEELPLQTRRTMFFQHDGAPPHFASTVRDFFDEHYPRRWIGRNGFIKWPPRCPDLTILDFYVWGTMKEIVYAQKISTEDELRQIIFSAAEIVREQLQNINFERIITKRAVACIQESGNHFEHLLK